MLQYLLLYLPVAFAARSGATLFLKPPSNASCLFLRRRRGALRRGVRDVSSEDGVLCLHHGYVLLLSWRSVLYSQVRRGRRMARFAAWRLQGMR